MMENFTRDYMLQMANEISRLRAENEKLRAAFTASSSQVILDNSNDGDGPKPKKIAERLKDYAQHEAFYMRETLEEAADEIEKLRAALNSIEAYVEGRVIAHRDIAELAESSMSGKKQRVRLSEASDILGKIRAAAAALKETGDE